jgi:glycosyltransferase involved in cell wall biosynthesis
MPSISIIIPVYNVEKYLRRCLDSVLAQTFTDYECILVDDGSPDNCPAICDEYVRKDNRFKVIHKKQNEGLPKARKSGLDIAIAEFVMHLDSDDWIEPNALELLYNKQQETGADIVMGGIRDIFPYGTKTTKYPEIYDNTDILVYFFLYRCRNLCSKLYKKYLFNDYIVPDTNIGEDAMVNIQLFSKLKQGKVQKIDDIIYNYDHQTESMSTKLQKKFSYTSYMQFPIITCRLWIEEYVSKLNVDKNVMAAFMYYMVDEGIIPYLRFNKKIEMNEVDIFYRCYYQPCLYKNELILIKRVIIPLFHQSIIIGKCYVFIINTFLHISRIINKYIKKT